MAEDRGVRLEENVRRVVVGVEAHRAEAEIVLVLVALFLLAMVPFQTRLEGPVLTLHGRSGR